MGFPSPTEKQARVLWISITALAIGILLALLVLLLWCIGKMLSVLSPVLLPLAAAGILAYLLDPVVNALERRNISRRWAILLVFFTAAIVWLTVLAVMIPILIFEASDLIERTPELAETAWQQAKDWLATSPLGMRALEVWQSEQGLAAREWLTQAGLGISKWLLARVTNVAASSVTLLLGLALVPIYAYFFLLEKSRIEKNWTEYLPLHESRAKEEAVFILRSINDHLVAFFRGQVLVGLCVGTLLAIGYSLMGLNHALLLGAMAAVLGIVPYLGAMVSVVPAVILAAVQFGDWWHPLIALGIFVVVQMAEGMFISPRIIGKHVGLHPVTIIIAVMVGTALLGGILGGILAIPLAATGRVLMFRYIWKRHANADPTPMPTNPI